MNNIFKVIWNHAAQLFVVTSELAKGKAKSASSSSQTVKSESSVMPKISLLSASVLLGLFATNVNAEVVLNSHSQGSATTVYFENGAVSETVPAPKATYSGIAIGNNADAYGDGSLISRDLIAIGNNATTSEHTQRVTVYNYLTPGNQDWRDITGRLTNVTLDPNKVYYSLGDPTSWGAIDRAAPAMALGYESFAHGGSVAIGGYAHAGEKVGSGTGNGLSVAIGAYSSATGVGSVAMGPAASAQGNNSFALMRQASATGLNSMALGAASYASTDGAIAIGRIATSTGKNSIAIGTGGEGAASPTYRDRSKATESTGDNTIAIGHNVKVSAKDSVGIGREAKAKQTNSVALGAESETRDATAETTGIVSGFTYGNFHAQGSTENGVVSIGKGGAERQLINVAAGKVSATSTDAINGSQLFVTNRGLANLGGTLVSNILGGDAAVVKNGDTLGTLTMSNIGGTGKNNINDAIKAARTEVKTEKQATLKTDTGANGQFVYTIGATKTTLTEGTKVSITGGTEDANGIINYNVGIDQPTSDKIDSIGTGNVAAGDTNTVTGATVHKYIEDNPITFVGEDDASPLKKKLGETLKFTSGDIETDYKGTNLKVKSDGTNIVVGFKEAPTFTNITADSLNITNGGPTINNAGINMNDKSITNVKNNLPVTHNKDANNDATTTQATPNNAADIGNNAATVNDILNAGWNLQENNTAKDFVKAYDTVNFVNGTGTIAKVTVSDDGKTSNVTFNIDKGNMAVDPTGDGTVKGSPDAEAEQKALKDAQDKLAKLSPDATPQEKADAAKAVEDAQKALDAKDNKVATVENVVNAINNASWTATSGTKGSGARVGATKTNEKVKAGDTVTFNAGDNLKIEQDGKDFTYSLNPVLTNLTSAGFKDDKGNTTNITATGNTIKDDQGNQTEITKNGINITSAGKAPVSLTSKGLDNGNNKITNVAAGEDPTDAVNVSQLKEAKADINNVANNVQSLEDNSPFEYADKDGNPVKKGLDGQYYKPEALKDKVFVDGKYYDKKDVNPDGSLINPATAKAVDPIDPIVDQVVIRAKGSEPQQVTNVKSNLPNTYNQVTDENGDPIKDANGNPVTTTTAQAAPSAADVKNMGNNAATVNDILNAGWNLQENGGAKDFVKAYDTVNFVDGQGTKANVTVREDGTIADVTFNIDKGEITMVTDKDGKEVGTVQGTPQAEKDAAEKALNDAKDTLANLPPNATEQQKADANKAVADAQKALDNINNKVATVENVVNAINNVSWTATSDVEEGSTGKRVEGNIASDQKVKAGDKVTFKAGDNLMIKQDEKNFTYSLNPELKDLTSAEFVKKDDDGNVVAKTKTDGDGVTITPAAEGKAPVSLTSTGLNNGNNSITNVKSNLPDTYNQVVDENGEPIKDENGNPIKDANGDPVKTTTAQKAPNLGDQVNNAATVNDILNAGWNLQENGGAKDFVKAYDTVNFVDGQGTKANVTVRENGTIADVTFNIDKGEITMVTDKDGKEVGTVQGTPQAEKDAAEKALNDAKDTLANLPPNATEQQKADANKAVADAQKALDNINNKVATVENVVTAINNASWTATSGLKEGGERLGKEETKEQVKAGNVVTFNAGKNLQIEQDEKNFTYSLNPELKDLTSAEFVGKDKDGNNVTTVTNGNGITITPENQPNTPAAEAKAPVSLTSTGLNNGNNSITNVKSNLPNTYNQVLDEEGNPIKDANGNPVTVTTSQAAPSAADVKNMGNNAATVNDILNAGWNLKENGNDKDFVKAYDTVNFVDGEGTKANVTMRVNNTIADVTFNIDKGNITMNPDDSGTVQGTPQAEKDAAEKTLNAAKDTLANLPATAPQTVKDAAQKAVQDAQKGVDNINNKVATVENVAYAINNAAWNVDAGEVEGSNGKLVDGSTGKPTKVKAGNTVKFNAGNNIEIKRNGQSIDIATSATPSFDHVSLGKDGARIGSDGEGNLRVSNAQGAPTRITNVAPGINNTDAVNYGQLRGAMNNINNRINKVDKDLRAGVAGATAMAFIQRPNEAGKSIVSVGAAGYRGESALAVGYARNADNNKISIKLGVGLNSRNDVTYGGSVGYQW